LAPLDVDVKKSARGEESLRALIERFGPEFTQTAHVETPSGGSHYYYSLADGIKNTNGVFGPGLETKVDAYVVAPPSKIGHREYRWTHPPETTPVLPFPDYLLSLLREQKVDQKAASGLAADECIPEGRRNITLISLAGSMRRRGMSQVAIEAGLAAENSQRCNPPLSEDEVRSIARSVGHYLPADTTLLAVRDYAHTETLALLFKGLYRWAAHRGSWMAWGDGVWQPATEQQMATKAAEELRREYARRLASCTDKDEVRRLTMLANESCMYARVQGALSFLKGKEGFHTNPEEWDADPWILNVRNGVVDLRAGELRSHSPNYLCTRQALVDFDPSVPGSAWLAHLERCLPSANVRRQVQRDLGLALVGGTLDEFLPIWFGVGANGKSTTARVMQNVLGDYAKKAAPKLLVQGKNDRHPTEIADLCGARLVFSIETDEGKGLAEGLVKDLTGGDRKKARFMRGDFFEFGQTFTIVLLVNHKPTISGTDEGIWRRVRLVPWTETIPEAERRPQDEIVAELGAEASAVLNWLLAGLQDWQRDHHWMAEEVRVATAAYRDEQDALSGFLTDCCELGPRFTAAITELHNTYATWCENVCEEPLTKRRFGELLRQRGIVQKRMGHGGPRHWVGIRLRVTNGDRLSISSHARDEYKNEPELLSPSVTTAPFGEVIS
jgi:putative DNA primase/helicase